MLPVKRAATRGQTAPLSLALQFVRPARGGLCTAGLVCRSLASEPRAEAPVRIDEIHRLTASAPPVPLGRAIAGQELPPIGRAVMIRFRPKAHPLPSRA